jgi:hypothetical protein
MQGSGANTDANEGEKENISPDVTEARSEEILNYNRNSFEAVSNSTTHEGNAVSKTQKSQNMNTHKKEEKSPVKDNHALISEEKKVLDESRSVFLLQKADQNEHFPKKITSDLSQKVEKVQKHSLKE